MKTHVITFSGSQGSGKTTTIKNISNRLTAIGKKIYVLKEFPFIPNIEMGTMDFQAWYKNSLRIRDEVVIALMEKQIFDVIFLDRHPIDVEIYTSQIIDERVSNETNLLEKISKMHIIGEDRWQIDKYTAMFLLERPYEDIVKSIYERQQIETHRKEWNEVENLKYIMETYRLYTNNPNIIFVENKNIDETIELIFHYIVEMI